MNRDMEKIRTDISAKFIAINQKYLTKKPKISLSYQKQYTYKCLSATKNVTGFVKTRDINFRDSVLNIQNSVAP